MSNLSATREPPLGAGLTSLVLGAVATLLFSLPILSIPLGGVGILFGIVGIGLALRGNWLCLRWAIAGLVVSGAALTVGVSIVEAPAGYLPIRAIPLNSQPTAARTYVSPPARPGE
jgi:hypothetical protein